MQRSAPLRRLQREQTHTRLIEAALRVFATRGYDHTTVDDVAAEAGYSKGAYYFHFATKEEVLLLLLESWVEERTQRLKTVAASGQPAAVVLMAMVEGLLSYEGSDPQWGPLLVEFWVQALRNDRVRDKLAQAYAIWRRLLAEAVEEARPVGVIASGVEPETAAAVVLSAHDGLVVQTSLSLLWTRRLSTRRLVAALLAPWMEHGEPTEALGGRRPAGR